MAKYEITTSGGVFEVETEDSNASFEDTAKSAFKTAMSINPSTQGAMKFAEGYGKAREGVSEFVSSPIQEGGPSKQISIPNPIMPMSPLPKIPMGEYTAKGIAKELGGLGFDQAVTLGTAKLPGAIGAIGKGVSNNTGKLVRGLAETPSKSVKTLREIGPSNVFKPELESEEFIGKNLTPKVSDMIRKSMGIPEEEIASLESKYKGSTTPIMEKVKSSLTSKVSTEEGRLPEILKNTPNSKRIRLNQFRSELTDSLTGLFKGGKLRKDIPKEDLKPIRELIDMYKDKREVFDKTEFLRRRSRLIDLQNSPSGEVASKATILKDALDMDAEQFGIEGIRDAKAAYKQAKEMEGRFLNRNTGDFKFGESKLSKVGESMPSQDADALKELESYIGQPFIDELSKVNKIRNISEQFSGTKIESLLKQAQKPENVQIKEQLKSILGDNYGEVEKLLTSNRIAQEFSPKGFYASRGGIVKGIARSGLRAYEEKIRPTLSKLMGGKK